MTTNEEVTDFLDRHLDAIASALENHEFDLMFTHALDVSFKKWCDDQWGRENSFTATQYFVPIQEMF